MSIYYKLTCEFIVINTIVLFIVIKTKITIIFYRKPWLTYCIFVNAASKYMMCTYIAYASVAFFSKIYPFYTKRLKKYT